MAEDDRRASGTDLQNLRRRLYAPGATDADHERYAEELARTRRPDPRGDAPDVVRGETEPPPRRSTRHGAVVLASALALVVGAALGAAVALQTTRSPSPDPASTRTAATAPLTVPRPVIGTPLGSAAQQRSDRREVAAVLRIHDATARQEAVTMVGSRLGMTADVTWMQRTGCTESIGRRSFSPTGGRSDLPAVAAGAPPFGTHFRIRMFMAQAAEWSWTASGRTEDGRTGVVALGGGGRTAGSSQTAEVDLPIATTIRSLDIRTSPATPFVWDLDSCTS